MKKQFYKLALGLALLGLCIGGIAAENVSTVAVLPFSVRGPGLKDQGQMVSDLMFATLVQNPDIWLVEREQLKKNLDELELSASGVVSPNDAVKIGKMLGARILITGSVFKFRNKTYVVAKVIGTETTKVKGCSVNGTESLDILTEKLGTSVSNIIKKHGKDLMPDVREPKDIIASLKKALANKTKPSVYININEASLSSAGIDPAAETEMQKICKALGFSVTEDAGSADINITGQAFSQFATRRGNLISVAARVEIKATDRDNKVLAVDRQSQMAVGLSEAVTGKKAIQEATAKIAEQILPQLVSDKK